MNYTLHQLRIFLKVAECQSITRAAEELHLTQPAISIQLKNLQNQFELPLIEVVGRQLYTTDFGKQIAQVSTRILREADNLQFTVDQFKGLLSGQIKISVVSTGKYVMPYFLKPFMDLHPAVDISLDVSNKNRVVEDITQNRTDFSLVSVVPEGLSLEKVELMQNKLFLVGSSQYKHQIKKVSDLSNNTLLFREEGSATRAAMTRYLETHGIKPMKSMVLVSNEAVKQAINAGIGLSIVPLIGLRNELANESMKIIPIKGLPIITNWNLVYNKGKSLTPAQLELVRFVEENKHVIANEHFAWTEV